ncbi:hypothetical protein TNCV_3550831 [Trichonephila clavipes]|nr:hypothetical protein TNCV_3550831 [Trichonephila clavipes]
MEVLLHHPVQLFEDTENIEQVQSSVDIHMCLHLLGLLCQVVKFQEHHKVISSNIVLFEANLEQGLYYAYPDIEPKYASSVEKAIKIEGKPNDLMTWHERFGHANVDYILKTSHLDAKPQQSNNGAVLASPGLKFSDYKVVENCEDDKTVNNIPASFPQNSDSETEDEEEPIKKSQVEPIVPWFL